IATETRSSPCDTACSEVPGSYSVLSDSSSITAPSLLHKHTRSKGPFLRRALPGLHGHMALSDAQTGRRPFWQRSESRPPANPEPPSLTQTTFSACRAQYPGGPDSGARWLASCAFPRRFLPCPCSLPRYRGGWASTSLLSRPAQASHALRPAQLLTHHTWALSRGSALADYSARALASYQVQPTTSLGGSFPHWESPPLGAPRKCL